MDNLSVNHFIPKINHSVSEDRNFADLTIEEHTILALINGEDDLESIAKTVQLDMSELAKKAQRLIQLEYVLFDSDEQTDAALRWAQYGQEADDPSSPPVPSRDLEQVISSDLEASAIDEQMDHLLIEEPTKGQTCTVESGPWTIETLAPIFKKIHTENKTGRLSIRNITGTEAKNFFFQDGDLINVFSKPFRPEECLGRILQRAGWIVQKDVVESLKKGKASGLPQGEQLVRMGKLRRNKLDEILTNQVELKVAPISLWGRGEYEFLQVDHLPSRIQRSNVKLPRLLFNLLFRFSKYLQVERELFEKRKMWIGKNDNLPYDQDEFDFGKRTKKFWEGVLEKDNTIKRLLVISNLNKKQTFRVLWVFLKMDMLQMLEDTREDLSLTRIDELSNRLRFIERETFFDILGVHWSANDEGVRLAYRRCQSEIEERISNAQGVEVELLRNLMMVTKNAYQSIRDHDERRAYRERIFDETFIEYNADIFRQKGESYLFTKEEFPEAITELENALEIWESNGETIVVLGLARFLQAYPSDRPSMETAKSLVNKGYDMVPETEIANLCMGIMHRREGRKENSKKYYGRALEVNPRCTFAKMELREIETGKKTEDRSAIIKEFLDSRSKSDKEFDKIMEKKGKAKIKFR